MYSSKWRWLTGLVILLIVIALLPPTRQAVLGLADLASPSGWFGEHQESGQLAPVDATTLAGHPGLYYQDASHLIGTISTDRYSAYLDLIAESKIDPDATIYTDKNLPTLTPVVVPTLPPLISGIKAGIGLAGGGSSGSVTLDVVPGDGIILTNGKVNAILGDTVDLSSAEVVSVLPVAKGGTGLSMTPLSGTILVGTGSGYTQALLSAGDGLTLISGNDDLSYALDGTVCRTSGNCSSLGIIGNGTTNYLAKFTGTGAIGSSLIFDDGSKVGIGTSSPRQLLSVGDYLDIYSGAVNSPVQSSIRASSTGNLTINAKTSQHVYFNFDTGAYTLLMGTRTGIGTDIPKNRLDVAGGVALGSYGGVSTAPTNGLIVSGNVGIGSISPSSNLVVSPGGLAGNAAWAVTFDAPTADSSTFALNVRRAGGGNLAAFRGDGNVGIGTTTPLSKLDVAGGLSLGSYAGINAAPANGLIVSGNVGIGTSSPGAPRLTVEAGDQTASRLRLSNTGVSGRIFDLVSGVTNVSQTGLSIYDATAGATRLVMDDAGKIGIGTTTPGRFLSILSTQNTVGLGIGQETSSIELSNPSIESIASGYPRRTGLYFSNHSETNTSRYAGISGIVTGSSVSNQVGALILSTKDTVGATELTERMRVNHLGNVGVGTSSPNARLHVESTTEQMRLGYDSINYVSFTTNSSGGLTITPRTTGQALLSGTYDISLNDMGTFFYRNPSWSAPSSQNTMSFRVGITPNSAFNHTNSIRAQAATAYSAPPAGITYSTLDAIYTESGITGGAGTVSDASALKAGVTSAFAGGTVSQGYGLRVLTPYTNGGVGSIGLAYGIRISPQQGVGVTNGYGIRIEDAATASLWLSSDDGDVASGIVFGVTRDTNLYRSAADTLKTDDLFVADSGVTIGSGGTRITKHLSATTTWDPASTSDDAVDSTTVTVTGAVVGDTVAVGFSQAVPAGAFLNAAVTASNTVTVSLLNKTGAPLDLSSGTMRADVWQH